MEYSYLISAVLIVLLVDSSLQDCRIVNTKQSKKPQNYWCNTIQDLERNGNAQSLDVTIFNGNTLPVLSNQTHKRTPSVQISLVDGGAEGLSSTTYKIMKDLHEQLTKNSQLTTITKGLFENLPLQTLRLSGNGIRYIKVGAFSNLQLLTELYITHNDLRSVETGIFNSLSVETLSLSNNKISTIKKNALFNLKNLKHLYLDGNYLSEFRPELCISYGSQLETLLLQHNYLKSFDRNTVKTLENLKVLNLDSNSITKIVAYSFENLLKIEELVLSNNQLDELDSDAFAADGMPTLAKLQINDNKISYLTPKLLSKISKLKYIRLGGNPWMCPCFDAILGWLFEHNIQQFCDFEYYSGMRPVCVVPEYQSTACDYSSTGSKFVEMYAEVNSLVLRNKECSV